MNKYKIESINGNEIIDFLNTISTKEISQNSSEIVSGSFVFEDQKIENGKYTLTFTGSFNNWGTEQEIHGNQLYITEKELWFGLEEPFEGDGTNDILTEALNKWLESHKFQTNLEEQFLDIITYAYDQLSCISYMDKDRLQKIIDGLIKAKTLIK